MGYLSVDVTRCRNLGHKFRITHSDKTPMKFNLMCLTESVNGNTAYAAYGVDTLSWGTWKQPKREVDDDTR